MYAHLCGAAVSLSFEAPGDPVSVRQRSGVVPQQSSGGRRRRPKNARFAHLQEIARVCSTTEEGDSEEIRSKIAQYEMAYRMQSSVPETMDVSG